MKKVLITGTCGFILSNFIRKAFYEKMPYKFVSVDRVSYESKNAFYFNKSHKFHIADIRDAHVINTIFEYEKPDIVIHAAAEASVDRSLSDPNSFITSNVLGTQIIANACIKHNVKKLIYTSTDEVYGQLGIDDEPWTEESPLNPRNPYAASKAAGELVLQAAATSHGLIYNITRSSNNYGPRQTDDKLIPRVIQSILNNKPIPVHGDGSQIREWTHVFDNCSALFTLLESGENNAIYNVGNNQEFSNLEIVNKICNIIGKGHDLITFVEDPRGNAQDSRYSVNSNKLKKIGWNPKHKISTSLDEHCVQWYLNNQWSLK